MKRLLIAVIFSLVFICPAFGQTSAVSGTINTLGTTTPTDRVVVRFTLISPSGLTTRVINTGNIINKPFDFTVTSGTFSGNVYQNDEITPAGTFYNICLFVNRREDGCNDYEINDATFDLDSASLLAAIPVVTPPDGDATYQRLDGGNSATGNYVPTSAGLDLGSASAQWDVFANLTATNVVFTGANGLLSGDSLFCFTAATNLLGVGVCPATAQLHVVGGDITFDNALDSTLTFDLKAGATGAQTIILRFGTFGDSDIGNFTVSNNAFAIAGFNSTTFIGTSGAGTFIRPIQANDPVSLLTAAGVSMFVCLDAATDFCTANSDLQVDGVLELNDTVALAASTTPSVAGGNVFSTNSTASITDFTGGVDGQIIYLLCGADTTTSLVDSTPLFLAGAFTCTADDSISLIFNGSVWTEISRSAN